MSETNVSVQRLVLCSIVGKGGRIFKRWCKPLTPILTPCCGCGFMHGTYAKDAATNKCLDCFASEAENKSYLLLECPPEPGDSSCYYPYILDEAGKTQTVLGETFSFGRSLDKILGSDE